jgi:two-component system, LuxR family, response regulator FixJ
MPSGPDIVLIVDDDRAVRDSLKFALEVEGLVVHVCADGKELLAHPSLFRARCLILDYKMPAMDGFSVLDHLAAREVRLPVILISARVTDDLRHRAALAGVWRTLEKPLLDGALLESIHDVLAGRGPPSEVASVQTRRT